MSSASAPTPPPPRPGSNPSPGVPNDPSGGAMYEEQQLDREEDVQAGEAEEAVHFCLLAEFDIDAGATLAHQYPYPTGTDEHRLAELMLPDGAHLRPEDWTVFYLGQTASSAVAPLLTHEETSPSTSAPASALASVSAVAPASSPAAVDPGASKPKRGVAGGGLLHVLNCVRMKEDKSVRRGAMVKAMAICTPNPYIGIYKPLLLLALEEYFQAPSPEILARLYDSANAISTAGMPRLTRAERILLRQSERKDIFEEKFAHLPTDPTSEPYEDVSSLGHHHQQQEAESSAGHSRMGSTASGRGLGIGGPGGGGQYARKNSIGSLVSSREGGFTPDLGYASDVGAGGRRGVPRDTHFFETEARFKQITVPIRIPMTVFDEDVGDYSLIELIQTFSSNLTPFPPPFHPHLHTNGAHTHPVILILNALLASKRVMFLGHGLPANQVARMVLASCALASGCGQVLSSFPEIAFPYANLASLDILEEFPGFVAGVTNPRFEELPSTWDVLCNLETGKVTVSKLLASGVGAGGGMAAGEFGKGSVRSGRSSETSSLSGSIVRVEEDGSGGTPAPVAKMQAQSKADCTDNQFMEDVLSAMSSHYGESHIRLRFTDYLLRFVRLAAHAEYSASGSTRIGYPSRPFRDGQLGSGAVFSDDAARGREMWANQGRIEAWRKTKSYKLYVKDWAKTMQRPTFDFDLQHQIARLRVGKNMSDSEAERIFAALAQGTRTHEQVVELLTHCPAYWGGLTPIANGMFHRWPGIRENAMELLNTLQHYPVGRQAVATMNYFHRKTYLQLLERRELILAQQRERQAQSRQWTSPSPSRSHQGHAVGLASPETVHGSAHATPQGLARG